MEESPYRKERNPELEKAFFGAKFWALDYVYKKLQRTEKLVQVKNGLPAFFLGFVLDKRTPFVFALREENGTESVHRLNLLLARPYSEIPMVFGVGEAKKF